MQFRDRIWIGEEEQEMEHDDEEEEGEEGEGGGGILRCSRSGTCTRHDDDTTTASEAGACTKIQIIKSSTR